MTTALADVADALGLTERTVGSTLNRAALADQLFILTMRFRVPQAAAAEAVGISMEEFHSARVRAHNQHRREMQEQQRVATDRRAGIDRKRHAPIGEPPTPTSLWCKRGHHWVEAEEMTRNRSRKSGYGDWCKAHFREYWAEHVKGRKKKAKS